MFLLVPDNGTNGGENPPPTTTPETPAPETPATNPPPTDEGEEWKGWWAAQLPKETREKHKENLQGLKGKQLGEVFDEYFINRTKLQNAVVFPGKDAAPEEIDTFLKKMDIPKTSEEYGIEAKAIPGPDTEETKAAAAKGLADFFRSIGLTKNQAKQMFAQYVGIIKSVSEAGTMRQKALADTFEERLLKDIGGDEKTATETKEYFKRALIALGDKQLVQELNQSGMLYSTAFVRGLADIYKAGNTEPPIPQAGPGGKEQTKDAFLKGEQFKQQYGGRK